MGNANSSMMMGEGAMQEQMMSMMGQMQEMQEMHANCKTMMSQMSPQASGDRQGS